MKKIIDILKTASLVIVVLAILALAFGRDSDKKESDAGEKEQPAASQTATSEETASEETSSEEKASEEAPKKDESKSDKPVQKESDTGPKMAKNSKYAVTINSYRITEDYDGAPCVAIDYTFTNVSDDSATSMQLATNITVYQNGVECEDAWFADANSDGYSNKVKAGVSVEVTRAYKLQDTTSDVEVEIAPLFNWNDELLAYEVLKLS